MSVTIGKPSVGLHTLLFDVAVHNGYFKSRGLAIKSPVLGGDAGTIPAVSSGSMNFAMATSTPTFVALQKKANIRIISPVAFYTEQIVMRNDVAKKRGIAAKSPIAAKMDALKGLRVGVLDLGGGLIYQLRAALDTYGLSRKDVKLVAVKPYTALVTAMERGDVDAIAPATPYGTYVVDRKKGIPIADIWNGEVKSMVNTPFELMVVNSKWAPSHKKEVKKVRAALKQAMDYVHKDPKGAAQIEKKEMPTVNIGVLNDAIGTAGGLPKSPDLTRKMFDEMQAFNVSSGQNSKDVSIEEAFWSGAVK